MKKVLFQLAFWIIFFLGWQRVVYFYIDSVSNRLLFTAFDVFLIILAFYCIYAFVMPRYFGRPNRLLFFAGLVVTILLTGLLSTFIMNLFLHRRIIPIRFDFYWDYSDLRQNRYFIAVMGTLAGVVTWLSLDRLQSSRKLEAAEKMRVSTELMYLKMQTNPHFLFNAINNIYIQVDVSQEEAKQTLSTFSDMLRYQLYECNSEKVPLEKEIAYIQDYIRLQSLTKDDRYQINFEYPENVESIGIAPFILIPLIENMFKHVSANLPSNIIRGNLQLLNGKLSFHGFNTFNGHKPGKGSGGIGLQNLQRRLELLYPGRHTLVTKSPDQSFQVWLEIQLT